MVKKVGLPQNPYEIGVCGLLDSPKSGKKSRKRAYFMKKVGLLFTENSENMRNNEKS